MSYRRLASLLPLNNYIPPQAAACSVRLGPTKIQCRQDTISTRYYIAKIQCHQNTMSLKQATKIRI